MHVTGIAIYPIKGTREVFLSEADVHPRGLAGDRRWMVVDADGNFLQQRVLPSMALIQTVQQCEGALWIDAPGMPRLRVAPPTGDERKLVRVWRDSLSAAVAGQEANRWLSDYLGLECQLVYMDQAALRPVSSEYGQEGDIVSFADAMPLLLATEASLADLNRRLDRAVSMSCFRPNVTIDGDEPWEEDQWKRIRVGDVEFELTHPCARCVVTTIDQQSGAKSSDGEPLRTLATFRRGPDGVYFGQNLVPRTPGTIRVGDAVTICSTRHA